MIHLLLPAAVCTLQLINSGMRIDWGAEVLHACAGVFVDCELEEGGAGLAAHNSTVVLSTAHRNSRGLVAGLQGLDYR